MKNISIIISIFLLPLLSNGQDIAATSENGIAFIEHAVAKSEGIQAIANRYKANYSAVLKLNNLTASSVLKEGQKLKIPISQFIQPACKGADCIKVYHTVKASEGLYRIGVNYGNIKMAQLKTLNNMSAETVGIGQRILVGYLPINPQTVKTEVLDAPAVAVKEVEKVGVIAPPVVEKAVVKETVPVVSKPVAAPQPAVVTPQPVVIAPLPEKQITQAAPVVSGDKSKGFFGTQFAKGSAEIYGLAASFKSESGWADNKFYVLMNEVTPGTVVMVALSSNTAAYIYAKVLGPLPQVKENEQIKFRLNDAAAAILGVGQQDNFRVTVVY